LRLTVLYIFYILAHRGEVEV